MRIALLSDVHANLPALEAVLGAIDAEHVDACYHLGDLVGYASWPDQTVALLAERGIAGISGNYDSTVATDYKHCGCRYEDPRQEELAHQSFEWTKRNTSPASKAALGVLPFRLDLRPFGGHASGPTIILVHGTPAINTAYWTEDRPDDFATRMIGLAGAKVGDTIAFGHTHKPWHRVVGGVHLVNTGSVGRPKDGDPRAGYVLLEVAPDRTGVAFRRVEYDVERAAAAVVASGLPAEFADHLRWGGTAAPASR